MVYQKRFHQTLQITYVALPHRGQDVIAFSPPRARQTWISVVDGWTNPKFVKGDGLGREAALWIARRFPRLLLTYSIDSFHKNASMIARRLDKEFFKRYPHHTAGVGAFLFPEKKVTVVTVGSVDVFYWDKNHWARPKEHVDYSLPYPEYPTDCSRFFGHEEFKYDPLYSCEPDVMEMSKEKPILIATDGFFEAMPLKNFQEYTRNLYHLIWKNPKKFMDNVRKEINEHYTQNDDITLLLITRISS